MYIVESKTRKQIADHYGCSDPLVKSRLREYGIRRG